MQECIVYYKEISGTVYDSDCTFSFIKKEQNKLIQTEKNHMLERGLEDIFHLLPGSYSITRETGKKPYLASYKNVHFNVSHTTARANIPPLSCIVTGFSNVELGVDVEYPRPLTEKFIKGFTTPQEFQKCMNSADPSYAAIRLWTLKEAYTKYTGEGMTHPFHTLNFIQNEAGKIFLEGQEELAFSQTTYPHGLCISVCTQSDKKIKVIPY